MKLNLKDYTLKGLKQDFWETHQKIKSAYSFAHEPKLVDLISLVNHLQALEIEIVKLDPTFNKPEIPF